MALHDRPTRRRFACSVAAVVGAGLAGCTGDALEEAYSSPPENTPISRECEREHQHAPDLSIWNKHSEVHSVTVVVTGVLEDNSTEPVYEEAIVVEPDKRAYRGVVFDPDEEDIKRYEDYVATATSEDGQTASDSVYSTVVTHPLRFDLVVRFEPDGELVVTEMHSDVSEGWTLAC